MRHDKKDLFLKIFDESQVSLDIIQDNEYLIINLNEFLPSKKV